MAEDENILEQMKSKISYYCYTSTDGEETCVFRPAGYSSFLEVCPKMLNGAVDEIAKKVSMVRAGIDKFTECEKLALLILDKFRQV